MRWLFALTLMAVSSGGCIANVDDDAGESAAALPTGGAHAACGEGRSEPPPPVPSIRADPTGRPNFDLWRDVPCEDAPPLCTPGDACFSCFVGQAGAMNGVCGKYGDLDPVCDGNGEVLGHLGGKCWICAPIETHARACCAGLAGFDCRAWPYPGDGVPGSVCARHEDCEAGLVCGDGGIPYGRGCSDSHDAGPCEPPVWRGGYGICQCPGATVEQPGTCSDYWRHAGGNVGVVQ